MEGERSQDREDLMVLNTLAEGTLHFLGREGSGEDEEGCWAPLN